MNRRPVYVDYLLLSAGAFLMGFVIKNIFDPAGLVTGGVSGIAIIIKDQAGIPLWVTNTALNIPLFLVSIYMKGWHFVKRTFIATVMLSLSLYVLPSYSFLPEEDLLLAALFGGILTGVGLGMVLMAQGTTGGTDMLASLIQKYLRHYTLAQILQVLDALIVLAGAGIFGVTYALYAFIAIFGVSKVSDGMIEGMNFSKAAYIISQKGDEIAEHIMERLERGVTGIPVTGMYSRESKNMLFCVVAKKEIVVLKELVREIDPAAFVIVSDAREVMGEGFIEY